MESTSSSINHTESIRRQYKEIIENPSKNPSELIELFKLAAPQNDRHHQIDNTLVMKYLIKLIF